MPNYPTPGPAQLTQVSDGANQLNTLLASGQSKIQSGQPLDDSQTTATQNLYNTIAGQQTANNTPGFRQGVINGTNLGVGGTTTPQISNNYDALAKQLASYDQMVLQPQFAGSNPGTASDLASRAGGGYFNPNLSYNTTDAQTPDQTLYNANPTYGLTGQADQGNSIVQLLNTLNNALTSESRRGQATYAGLMNSTGTSLSSLDKLLGQSTDIKKANLAAANKGPSALELKQKVLTALQQVQGKDFHVSPDDYARIKNEAGLIGVDPKDFDTWAQQYRNPDQSTLFPTDPSQVDPASLTSQERTANQKGIDSGNSYKLVSGGIQGLLDQYSNLSGIEKSPITGNLAKLDPYTASAEYEKQKKALAASLKELAGAGAGSGVRVNQTELTNWANLLPRGGETTTQAKTDVNTLNNQLKLKFGKGLDQSYLDQFGIIDTSGGGGGGPRPSLDSLIKP